jgi:hypothetical protein
MGKTRKCRLDENEIVVHDMAVKLRKKTDAQLVEAFQQIYDQGYQNGIAQWNNIPEGQIFFNDDAKRKFLDQVNGTQGIGKALYDKIEKIVLNTAY